MIIESNSYQIVFGKASVLINDYYKRQVYSSVLIIVDENTERECLSIIKEALKNL